MDSDLPFLLKMLALTLALPLAIAWLASLAGVTGIALRSRLRRQADKHPDGKP